jgi:DNA segregation ATPase FtsK/SpoIIIE, S-DNA-T family
MAKNVARPKLDQIPPPRKPTSGKQVVLPFQDTLQKREYQLGIGMFIILLSIFLAIALLAYLFTGNADQSIVQAYLKHGIKPNPHEIKNIFGLFGAVVAYKFMFHWFGVSSLAVVPILFVAGSKIAFRREIFPLKDLTYQSVFYLFWISMVLGFVVFASKTKGTLDWLSGGVGYEINVFLYHLIGWFSIIVIVFVLFVFVVSYYKVTSLEQITGQFNIGSSALIDEYEDEIPQAKAKVPQHNIKDDMANLKPERPLKLFSDEEEIDEDAIIQQRVGNLAAEAAKALAATPETDEPIKVNTNPKTKADGPTFTIESTEVDTDAIVEEDEEAPTNPFGLETTEDTNEQLLKEFGPYDPKLDLPHYEYPTLELMKEYQTNRPQVTQIELESNKDKIVATLGEFGIGITSIKATVGPTVTLYEIIPDAGVRISKIKSLEDDIALKLAALGIRIIAPIPGKGTIGIEVPNKNREMVAIRGLLASEKFQESKADLPVVLGKTISNEIFLTDLAKMPHLLMAGATGQGKSVGLNVLLASLLFKKHPAELKFVLVDPKKVELSLFSIIERHFLAKLPNTPEAIITDTKKVVDTLNSLCIEMDMRYNLLKDAGCRNLKEYNAKFVNRRLNPEKGHRYMPYIVLVIDELADLMMTAGKEVEQPIARLAQLARAIGIHLVVATQRPSVNVITGIIKANFPARLSFKVTAKVDSRTILDTGGAEQLVGMGDMLLSQGSDLIRLQCAFVDTPEVESVCEFIGNQRGYDTAYLLPEFEGDESGTEASNFDPNDLDPMFEEAARLIVIHQQGSTSLIQRRLKLGYNRAGRLIDQLEKTGIVGSFEGSKAREVLVKTESELDEILKIYKK